MVFFGSLYRECIRFDLLIVRRKLKEVLCVKGIVLLISILNPLCVGRSDSIHQFEFQNFLSR